MHKFYLHEKNIKFMYFDTEQKVRSCWVLLGHVEVEKNTTYISYDYFKRTLWYKLMFYFAFYHLTRFGYLKIYKNILRIDTGGCSVNCSTSSFRMLCNSTFRVTLYIPLVLNVN